MHPMMDYESLRHGREELLRQAEQERLARQLTLKHWWQKLLHFERQHKEQNLKTSERSPIRWSY